MSTVDANLAAVQAWFQRQMTGDGLAPGWPVNAVIEPSPLRTSAERLAVYQNAYVARLLDCLSAEFPAVKQAVGPEAFLQFVRAHLSRHPPHSYTLGQLGADFAETLENLRPPREGPEPDFADFLVELARYERTVSEVFDAEGPERAAPPNVAALASAAAENLRIACYPSVRLLELVFPVHESVTAVRAGRPIDPPAARPVRLLVFRREFVVRRREVAAWQFALLRGLQSGGTLSDAMERAITVADSPDDFATAVFRAFEEWTRDGLFRAIEVNQPRPSGEGFAEKES